MKIFGINMSSNNKFRISDDDKLWVEENFRWLKEVFGYPNRLQKQIVISPEFFPLTFGQKHVSVTNVIADLCRLLGIDKESVKFVLVEDVRDWNNVPYQIEGKVFECETDLKKGEYTIYVANSLQEHPERLIYSLIYEFIRIRLTESELEYDVGGDDTSLFIFLAGIYYGFGVVLARNLYYSGRRHEGMWEIKWNYGSQMPEPVLAFALATYANLTGENNPAWKNDFKDDFRTLFEGAIDYLIRNPSDLYDEAEVKANDLFNLSNEHFDHHRMEEAISTLQKILFITKDDTMKADVYNNIGYYYMRIKEYRKGISNFRKAIELGPEYGYANDNLGYALIMTGELEEGFKWIQRAIDTGNNDDAYSYRNLALYHQKNKNTNLAEEFFQKAFSMGTPVDLLEFHYGEFLLEQGQRHRAKTFFQMSADKNEEEGIGKVRELS